MSDEFKGNRLPPFPVDDATLDLMWAALHPGPEADRSSLSDFLELMAQMGGSDPNAVAEETEDGIRMLRDQFYSHHDVVSALINEVRRLRKGEQSALCEHPAPVWVTAIGDSMPRWHCSGCNRIFRGDPDEIRAAEARGQLWALGSLADTQGKLAHALEDRDEFEAQLNEWNEWANDLARFLGVPEDLDPFFGIDRVAREQVRWIAEAEGRDVTLPWQNEERTNSVAAFHSAEEGPLVGDRIDSGGLGFQAWLKPDVALAKAAALHAAAREAERLAATRTPGVEG